jgi:nitrate reductase cytochrome c-type subunit
MKTVNIILYGLFFTLAILLLCYAGTGYAYHDGGVARCEGCHTMHNSLDGAAMATKNGRVQFQAGPYLLKGSDSSSTCLNCHERAGDTAPNGYHISTADSDMPTGLPPIQLTPGGDFGWLKKTYNWTGEEGPETSRGERHGHNIIAIDYGYTKDTTHLTAPGGDAFQYPSDSLSCVSCHDPHGQYRRTSTGTIVKPAIGSSVLPIADSGSYDTSPDPTATTAVGVYRLLGGIGYQPKSLSGSYAFQYRSFFAVAPSTYNRSESATDVRVAYGNGVSPWCSNCHANMHPVLGSMYQYEHPVDSSLSPTVIPIYDAYKKTGDLTGLHSTAYLSLTPFQMDNTTNMTTLKNAVTSTAGPVSGDRIMCLSCHRAHATAWDSITRFPLGATFMTVSDGSGNPVYPDPSTNPVEAMGRTTQEYQQALYDRPASKFAVFQRVLCNKCHARD